MELLQNMCKKMEALYDDLAEYYVFDKSKYTLEEFFSDIKIFKDNFYVSSFRKNYSKYSSYTILIVAKFYFLKRFTFVYFYITSNKYCKNTVQRN